MAISALKLKNEDRSVLYSECIESLDRYGGRSIAYSEDLQTRLLEEDEFDVVKRLLEGIDWAKVDVIKRGAIKMEYFHNRPPKAHYEDGDVLDELLANISSPTGESTEYTMRWNAISGIVKVLGKKE
ncbi:hypothetical protein HYT57_02190 [Candidatus Woesearchaeota archaeon]|nr:hypothetical protein [Candidatus Woesearchaeota archaeon]